MHWLGVGVAAYFDTPGTCETGPITRRRVCRLIASDVRGGHR